MLRIFGITEHGQKVAAHVHGVYPYLFIPWSLVEPPLATRTALAASINAALHRSLNRNSEIKEEACGNTHLRIAVYCTVGAGCTYQLTTRRSQVFDVTFIKKLPYYGYHVEEQAFLRIQLCNPWLRKRVADILQEVRGV